MKKARVIVTLDCNRKCPNCSNSIIDIKQENIVTNIDALLKYDMIMITGGEPMLIKNKVQKLIWDLRSKDYEGLIYLYTAMYNKRLGTIYANMLHHLDGLQFTLHNEATCQDVIELKQLSESSFMKDHEDKKSLRLSIDNRLYDKYDFSNIDFSSWSVVRKLQWLDECPMPSDEELILYRL